MFRLFFIVFVLMAFKILYFTAAVILFKIMFEIPATDAAPLPISSRTSVIDSKTGSVIIGSRMQSPRTQLSPSSYLHPVSTLTVVAVTYGDPYAPFMWAPAAKFGLTISQNYLHEKTAVPVVSESPWNHPGQFSAHVSPSNEHGQFPARVSPSGNPEHISTCVSTSYDSIDLSTRVSPFCGPAQLPYRDSPFYDPAQLSARVSASYNSVKFPTHVTHSYDPAQLYARLSPSYDSVDLYSRVSSSYDPVQFIAHLSSYDQVQFPAPVSSLYDPVQPTSLVSLLYDPVQLLVPDSQSQTQGKQNNLQDVPFKIVSASTPMIVVASPYINYPESPIMLPPFKLSLQLKTGSLDTSRSGPINPIQSSTTETVKVALLTRTVASQYIFRTTIIGLSRSNQEQSDYRSSLSKVSDSGHSPQISIKNISNGIHQSIIIENDIRSSLSEKLTVADIVNTESNDFKKHLLSLDTRVVPGRGISTTEREKFSPSVRSLVDSIRNVSNPFPVQTNALNSVQDSGLQPKPKSSERPLTTRLMEKGVPVIEMERNRDRNLITQTALVTGETGFARRWLQLDDTQNEAQQPITRTSSLEHHSSLSRANAARSLPFETDQTQLLALPTEVSNFQYFHPTTRNSQNPTPISYVSSANLNSLNAATSTGNLRGSVSAPTFHITWPMSLPPPYLTPPGTSSFHVKMEDYQTTMNLTTLSPNFDRLTGVEWSDHLDIDFYEGHRQAITFDKEQGTKIGKPVLPTDIGVNYTNVSDYTNVRSESLTSQPPTTYQQMPLTNRSASNALYGHLYPALNASILSVIGYFLLQIVTFMKNLKQSGVTSSEEMLRFLQTNSILKKYDFVRNPDVAFEELLLSVEANSEILNNGSQVLIKMLPEDKKTKLFQKLSVIVEKIDKILSMMRLNLPKQLSLQEILTFLYPFRAILGNSLEAVAQSLEVQQINLQSNTGEIDIESMYNTFNQGLDRLVTALNSLQSQSKERRSKISSFEEFWKAMEKVLSSLLRSEINVLSLFGNPFYYYKTLITDSMTGYFTAVWGTLEIDSSWISRFLQLMPRIQDFLSLVSLRPEFITSVRNASILNKQWDVDEVTSYLKEKLDRIRSTWTKTVFFFDLSSSVRKPNVPTFEANKMLAASCLNMLVENWNYTYRLDVQNSRSSGKFVCDMDKKL